MSSLGVQYVDHTYREFSRYEEEGGKMIKHKKSTNNFPARLHRMLSDGSNSHAIVWMVSVAPEMKFVVRFLLIHAPICYNLLQYSQPHGRAWKVINKSRLLTEVLPKYYGCIKYESFIRQLNGFKRLHQSGPDFGSYYHECFLRNLPKLTCFVRRLASKKGKTIPFAQGEPNLYMISAQYPLPVFAVEEPAVANEPESKPRAASLDLSAESTSPTLAGGMASAPSKDMDFSYTRVAKIRSSHERMEPEEIPADRQIGSYNPSADFIYSKSPYYGDLHYSANYSHCPSQNQPQPQPYYNPSGYHFQFNQVPRDDRLPPEYHHYTHGMPASNFCGFEGSTVPSRPLCISHPGSPACHIEHSFRQDNVRSGDCSVPLEPIPISHQPVSKRGANSLPPQMD
ncbi:hypothetical protein ACHAWF_007162 [Thalassiosira exigua]